MIPIKIIFTDSSVKSILVNVFGGIVNCATIAKGLINASKKLDLKVPLVVRLEGKSSINYFLFEYNIFR
jgi:succinyl-CoA synthetase beta subunit